MKIQFLLVALTLSQALMAQHVGIGTTTPAAPLHVAGTNIQDTARGTIILSRYWANSADTRSSSIYHLYNSNSSKDQMVFGVSGDGGVYTSPAFYSNAKMVIQANGSVGIGTVSPSEKLEVAGNTKANNFIYTTPKTYYYSIDQSAFTARDGSQTMQKTFSTGGAFISGGNNYGIVAPVSLPHGAAIAKISIGFYDIVAAQDLQAKLVRFDATAGIEFFYEATLTSSGSGGLQTVVQTFPTPLVINNSIFSYSIMVFPTSGNWTSFDLMVKGVIIEYTLSEL